MTHRFQETMDTLIGAFIRGELIHGVPCGCAVGNMLGGDIYWTRAFCFDTCTVRDKNTFSPSPQALTDCPYSPREILMIENEFEDRQIVGDEILPLLVEDEDHKMEAVGEAFRENADEYWDRMVMDPDGFIGLCNVLDVLSNDIDADYFREMEERVDVVSIANGQCSVFSELCEEVLC